MSVPSGGLRYERPLETESRIADISPGVIGDETGEAARTRRRADGWKLVSLGRLLEELGSEALNVLTVLSIISFR